MKLLITGSTGIAGATARLARERGDTVVTIGLDSSADLLADLRDEAATEAAVARAIQELGGDVDALFNAAGASVRRQGDGAWHECTLAGFQAAFEVNVQTTFLVTRTVLRHWLAAGRPGSVVTLGSVLADAPEPTHFASHGYTGAKGALAAMTKAAAARYASQGIRFNLLAPGLVRTPMSVRAQENEEIMRFVAQKQALSGGILEADDVARAALFLLGADSRHATGQVFAIDGGWSVL